MSSAISWGWRQMYLADVWLEMFTLVYGPLVFFTAAVLLAASMVMAAITAAISLWRGE